MSGDRQQLAQRTPVRHDHSLLTDSADVLTTPASGLILRQQQPPVDQRDLDDRHDTRATSDDETLKRYVELSWQRTRRDWHQTLQRLVTVAVDAVLYVAAIVVLQHLLPDLSLYQDMVVAAAALGTPYAGHAVRLCAEAVRLRYVRRQRPRR